MRLLVSLVSASTGSYFCEEGWNLYNGRGPAKCIKYFNNAVLKPDGKKTCLENDAILLVINSRHENKFVQQAASDNGWNTFWLGINDGKNEKDWVVDDSKGTIKATYFNWNYGEPNNWGGHEENSVEFFGVETGAKLGKWNDVHRWEVQNFICQKRASTYQIFRQKGTTWQESREECQRIGADLVTFDDPKEYDVVRHLVAKLSDTDVYWVGYQTPNDLLQTSTGDTTVGSWVSTYFLDGEPNNKMGEEDCIRMRWSVTADHQFSMNDAPCTLYWAGPKKANIGMGFICEIAPVDSDTLARLEEEDEIREQEESIPDILYVNSYVLNHDERSIAADIGRKKGTFGIFRRVKGEFEKINDRVVYESMEHTNSYFYFLDDKSQWNHGDGFWKFGRGKGSTRSAQLKSLQNDKSVSGFAFVDASRPNPLHIENPKCWQNSQVESEHVEFNCLKNPEFYLINPLNLDDKLHSDTVIGFLDEYISAVDNIDIGSKHIGIELRVLLGGVYSLTRDIDAIWRPSWTDRSTQIYKKRNAGIYMIPNDQEGNILEFYTARGIANKSPIFTTSTVYSLQSTVFTIYQSETQQDVIMWYIK